MSKNNLIACIVTTLTVIVLFVAYFNGVFGNNLQEVEIITPEYHRQYIGDSIEIDGHAYRYNNDLYSVLFLGVDTREALNRFTNPAYAGQSDAIYLLTINRNNGESRILQINRNTMVDINIYNPDGQVMLTQPGQICLQYAYGTGDEQSIWATKNAVSKLLLNIPIDSYFVMNLEAINLINDAMGGVYITMPQDYTVINPSMTSGSRVHIMGDTAERFVRYRDTSVFNSVQDRMDRQVLYITALFDTLCDRGSYGMYEVLEPFLGDTVLTNIQDSGFDELYEYDYSNCQIDTLPGEEVATDNWEEFHVDYDALEEYVIENFYVLSE